FRKNNFSYEIIIVNDGSLDSTVKVVEECRKSNPNLHLKLANLERNMGKGMAVKKGIEEAQHDIIMFFDADLSCEPSNIKRAFSYFENPDIDIVIGDRNHKDSEIVNPPSFLRRISGKIYAWMVGKFILKGITDSQCGFKVFRKEAAKRIFRKTTIPRFGFDVELLYIANKANFRIMKMPVRCINSPGSRVKVISDSLVMFKDLFIIKANDRKGLYDNIGKY
ncbi:MAG: hypothetical protein A2043_02235, partial [Candidatus Schekmanbacteria bacterium GWA2_38_9]